MSSTKPDQRHSGFGTFGGVFTPCTLTILGVIMFLRFGYVVGQAGLWSAILIVICAKVITTLTTLSLSAIATNTRVEGGGAYFLISRSLGVEFGGAIGSVFFLAQAISVAMYVIGFSEALWATWTPSWITLIGIATITNMAVFACVYIGAGWTIKVQYFILGTLGLALISFYTGGIFAFDQSQLQENFTSNYNPTEDFFTMFALFFPAVTGIMAGANMSGDLKQPSRSIPIGTLWSVVVTGLIYLSMAVILAGSRSSQDLSTNNLIIGTIAVWPILITTGVFAATLSSALGSMMGAPRILQALARDNVFPSLTFFGTGSGANLEPRRAVVLTFLIAQLCIVSADLNTIAPLITMFFMITYGLLNLATFFEAVTKNPSYRPRFRYCHWSVSLLGAIGCLVVMCLIDFTWACVSIFVMYLLHAWIARREVEARWGDLHSGVLFERARKNLLKLEDTLFHPKNWRPIILALSGRGWNRPHLAIYGHWLTSGHGILILGQVIQGEVDQQLKRRSAQERLLYEFIKSQELQAFPAVVVAPTLSEGIDAMVQCQGLGFLHPNTVLLGWPKDADRALAFTATMRTVTGLDRSIIAIRTSEEVVNHHLPAPGTIDVWWRGLKNGELMLLLAFLLTKNTEWRGRTIRLLRVIENEAGHTDVLIHLNELIESSRIAARPQVIITDDLTHSIQQHSRHAAVVILGFELPEVGQEASFFERMEELSGPLPRVVFVNSAGKVSLES